MGYKAFPDLFLEQCRQMSYSNLGLFWSSGSVFFEMSDIYMTKEDSRRSRCNEFSGKRYLCDHQIVPSLPLHVYIWGECYEMSEIKSFMRLCEAALPYIRLFLSRVAVPKVQSLTMPRRSKSLSQKTFTTNSHNMMYSRKWVQLVFRQRY